MVTARVPRGRLWYWEKRFATEVKLHDAVFPVHYLNTSDQGELPGFIREIARTLVLDLEVDDVEILRSCRANTRNEISRASREGVVGNYVCDWAEFLDFYNQASRHAPLPEICPMYLRSLGTNVSITVARWGGRLLAGHVYVTDRVHSRVRLIRSASVFRGGAELRNIAGRANRFLHYHDTTMFRGQGFRWYDLGGYDPDSKLPEIRRISAFKASFGGALMEEVNYLSLALHLYRSRRHIFGDRDKSIVEDM